MRTNLFKGAAGEHYAAAYYISEGCGVYWPSIPLECDLIVERTNGRLHKVQVKYAAWNKHGRNSDYEHLHCRTYGWSGGRKKSPGKPKYDFLFVVSEDGRMWEIPSRQLPEHAITLETRGGRYKLKTKKKWERYLVT